MCLLGFRWWIITCRGPNSKVPHNPYFGGLNRHIKPNMRRIPRWRTAAILKIDMSPYVSEKSADFHENVVHSSRFWIGWTSRDQKWKKIALDRLRVRQNVFLVWFYDHLIPHLVNEKETRRKQVCISLNYREVFNDYNKKLSCRRDRAVLRVIEYFASHSRHVHSRSFKMTQFNMNEITSVCQNVCIMSVSEITSLSVFTIEGNYVCISCRLWDCQHQIMAWPWNRGWGSFKVAESGTVR